MQGINQTTVLRAVFQACEFLNPEDRGGAHADVLAIDPLRLGDTLVRLARLGPTDPFAEAVRELAAGLGERFLLKRGKIEDFRMQLVGSRANVLPRDRISHAFGPYGYNVLPTVDKALIDAHEAAREIPYLGCGAPEDLLAPDIIGQLQDALLRREQPTALPPTRAGLFLRFLDEVEERHADLTLYSLLQEDIYFKGKVDSFDDLASFQRFVRTNPLTRTMEDQLEDFFSSPITVGLRDTVRWAMGSRHPDLGWERARQTLMRAFERHQQENFLPA